VTGSPAHLPRVRTLLGVWAHPDDEAYLSSALMAAVRRTGARVVVVTATHGEHGTDDPARWPPDRLAAERERELRASLDVVGVTDQSPGKTQIWATWQAGKPNFGSGPSTVTVALASDRNGDGVLNDAPDKVADADGDGDVDQKDLQAIGATSIKSVDFTIG